MMSLLQQPLFVNISLNLEPAVLQMQLLLLAVVDNAHPETSK
jgi:hypothetical protein